MTFGIHLKRRRSFIPGAFLFILSYAVAWSWTTRSTFLPSRLSITTTRAAGSGVGEEIVSTKIPHPFQERRRRGTLPFSDNRLSDLAISESDLIQSIIQSKSSEELHWTLRSALRDEIDTDQVETQSLEDHDNGLNSRFRSSSPISLARLSFNVTAAVLRRMAHLSVNDSRCSKGVTADAVTIIIEKSPFEENPGDSALRKELLVTVLERVGQQLVRGNNRSSLRSSSRLDVYPLSDALQALAVLAPDELTKQSLRPLATIAVNLLDGHESQYLYKLGPVRLVQCLQAMARLNIVHSSLQERVYHRLLKPDAVSKLPPQFLAHGLWALAALQRTISLRKQRHEGKEGVTESTPGSERGNKNAMLLSRAFMRRLRKKKALCEASTQDLLRGLVATRTLLELGVMKGMEDEAAIFGFTTLRAVLSHNQTDKLWTATQFTDMISSWACLSSQGREDAIIGQLLQLCRLQGTLQMCNLWQLERISRSIAKLEQMTSHADIIQGIGEQLLVTVEVDESADFEKIYPQSVNQILRYPVLTHRRNKEVLRPYAKAASLLLRTDSFVQRCNVAEIANFLWFLSAAQCYDEVALVVIGRTLLDTNISDACSPKMASRILATFTALVSLDEQDLPEATVQVTKDLFHYYGGHLLSSSLSPTEVSSALYAYAKASYIQDMGVFDHLVNLLASMAKSCTSRQLSQSLWSCGKMIGWEEYKQEQDPEGAVDDRPPYFENAVSLAFELSRRLDEMSPEDVTQTIWALGRLAVKDEKLMSRFARRAICLSPGMNAVEISNILWGMAKAGHKDRDAVTILSNRFMDTNIHVSPKVAASSLYALGRLQYRDEKVFGRLAKFMMDSIEDVNAQSIANSLWAFRTMRIQPPQELLSNWATHKLGITSIYFAPPK